MKSQWNYNGYDTDKLRPAFGKARPRTGLKTGHVVAIAIGVAAVVLTVGVLVATLPAANGTKAAADDTTKSESGGDEKSEDGGDPDPDSGSYPATGDYQVVHEETGLCLTTGPEPGNEERDVIVLGDCGKTYPKTFTWKVAEDRRYTVELDYTKDNWRACLSADKPADDLGYLMAGQDCDKKNDLQVFELSDRGGEKYGIAVRVTGMCLGPLEDTAKKGMAISTVECADDDKAQSFTLKQ